MDGVALAAAVREVTVEFAAQPDPELEARGLGLAGRIVTRILGPCHAFVGRAMLDAARCAHRNGDPDEAAGLAEAVVADFAGLLDEFEDDDPFDEDVIALEHLLTAIDLIAGIRGGSPELTALGAPTRQLLARADH